MATVATARPSSTPSKTCSPRASATALRSVASAMTASVTDASSTRIVAGDGVTRRPSAPRRAATSPTAGSTGFRPVADAYGAITRSSPVPTTTSPAQEARRSGPARRRRRAPRADGPRRPSTPCTATGSASGSAASRRRPRLGRCSRAPRTRTRGVASSSRAPTVTVLRSRVLGEHVAAAPPAAMPRPLRWPTVKWWWPRWRPTTRPPRSTISPGRSRAPPWRARNAARAVPARKQRSWESGLRRPAARLGGQRAHLRLGQLAEREAQPRERRRRQRGEHVGLVLGRVGGERSSPSSRSRA